MRSRWIRAALLAVLVAGGVGFYRTTLRPDPRGLATFADRALRDLFGPHATHGAMTVDPLQGVRVQGLRVPRLPDAPGTGDEPALSADLVIVRHDPLALLAGVLRLESIVLEGPSVSTHETDSGEIALDFPFDPPRPEGPTTRPPRLVIERGTFRLRSSPTSSKLKPGHVFVLSRLNLDVSPGEPGQVAVRGSVHPEGVGLQPEEEITIGGQGDLMKGTLEVTAAWKRLRLTTEVKDLLAPRILEQLVALGLEEGPHTLWVTVRRDPDLEAGRVRVDVEFTGTARLDVAALPGGETIDARTREQLNDLFDRLDLQVKISGSEVRVKDIAASMAGGELLARGTIRDGGATVDVEFRLTDLRLDDPALRRLIGEDAFARFGATGMAAATISVRREAGGPFEWEAEVDLIDATLVYRGVADPVLKTPAGNPLRKGFPYEIRQCYGKIHVNADRVRFREIKGRHGKARIRIRGAEERSRAGGPTGYVRFLEGDTEFCLTIEAQDIAIDRDIEEAVEGSEFAGLLDRFRPSGVVDRVVLDIVKRPAVDDAAVVELELSSRHIDFVFADFPIPYDVAEAEVTILRPPGPTGARGKEFHVRARGTAGGGETTVVADLFASDRRGRVRVEGLGVRFEGDLEAALLASVPGQGELGRAWRFLHPGGTADVRVDLPAFDDPGPPSYEVVLHDARVAIGDPADPDGVLALEGLEGTVRATGGRIALDGVRGHVGDAQVTLTGSLDGGTEGRWDLEVAARDLRVTRGLLHVIEESAAGGRVVPEGIDLRPGGRMDLTLGLHRDPVVEPEHVPPLTATVQVRRADLVARLGEVEMRVRGGFSVEGDVVRVEDLLVEGRGIEVRIPQARVAEDGLRGRIEARLTDVRVGEEVLGLLPADLRPTFAELTKDRLLQASDLSAVVDESGALTLRGSLGLTAPPRSPPGGAPRGLVEFAPVTVSAPGPAGEREVRGRLLLKGLELDVGTRLEDVAGALDVERLRVGGAEEGRATLTLDRARVAGFELRGATVPLVWQDGILAADPVSASVYGGSLAGAVRVHTRAPVALEGHLRIDALSLSGLAEALGGAGTVSGTAALEVEFQSRGSSLGDLTASGTATVCDGDLGELPPIATIPALFSAIVPGSTKPRFERAQVRFVLRDEVLEARDLQLGGPIFDLCGRGTLDLSGRVDLTLAPQFLKSFFLPGSLQIPVVRDVLWLLREDPLYVVRVRGPIEDPETTLEPFPFLGPPRRGGPEWEPTPFQGRLNRRVPRQFH